MNSYLKDGLREYRKQCEERKKFQTLAPRVATLLSFDMPQRSPTALLCLTPLVEVSWVDGRIGNYEQDSVLETADVYGLLDNEEICGKVMERLTSRPHPKILERWWSELTTLCLSFPPGRGVLLASCMYKQTRFISSLGQPRKYGMFRGSGRGDDENESLENTRRRLRMIRTRILSFAASGTHVSREPRMKI